MNRYLVVSADGHVGPSVRAALRPYCARRHLELFDEYVEEMEGASVAANLTIDLPAEHLERLARHGRVAGLSDPHARHRDMDEEGIAADVIFHGGVNGQSIPFASLVLVGYTSPKYRDLSADGHHIYNRWLADFVSVAPERHVGVAQFELYDLDRAVEEVEWARSAGLTSVNLPGQREDVPGYNDCYWEPLWAACEANGMVLSTHAGGGQFGTYTGVESTALFLQEISFWGRRPVWFLIFGGVFERHPALRLVVTEQFGDWVDQTMRDMDSAYLSAQQVELRKVLPHMPSDYFRRNVSVGASFMSRREAEDAVALGYTDQLLWGADYPHQEGTWPRTKLSQRATFSGLPIGAVRAMLGENAATVYNLDRAALEAHVQRIGPTVEELAEPVGELPADMYHGNAFRTVGKWA